MEDEALQEVIVAVEGDLVLPERVARADDHAAVVGDAEALGLLVVEEDVLARLRRDLREFYATGVLYLGSADSMSIARVWVWRYSKRRGGHFEYQHTHTPERRSF